MKQIFFFVIALALGGCEITISSPANNAMVILPSPTMVTITGNASYTGLTVIIDGVDYSSQMISTGSSSSSGSISLAAGLHTVVATAQVNCWYCSGGKTLSTSTRSFIVTNGGICGSTGGTPVITITPSAAQALQQPGRKYGSYISGNDGVFIIVDDAPGLLPTQMRVELDIDPSNVTWTKAIEAWGFCRSGFVGKVEASMSGGFGEGVFCNPLTTANDYRSGCTKTQTMLIDQYTTNELWFRKPGLFGIWGDAEVIDASMWQAFGGRSVRFIWRFD